MGLSRSKELEFWAKDGGPLTLQNLSGSIHLALFENDSIQNTVVAFKVGATELFKCIKHLSINGIRVEPIDHEVSWSVYFKDPDGNPYEITTYEYDIFSELIRGNE